MSIFNKTKLTIIITISFVICFPVWGLTQNLKAVVCKPHQDNIELYREALVELDRQTIQWLSQNQRWLAYFDDCAATNAAYTEMMMNNLNDYEKLLDMLVKAAQDNEYESSTNVPGYGFSTVADFQQFRTDRKAEIAKQRASIAAGSFPFGLHSFGDSSSWAIAARKKEHLDKIEAIRQSIHEGNFEINFQGLGDVTRNYLEAQIAASQKALADKLANFDENKNYSFDFETRKELDGSITSTQKEFRKLESDFQAGNIRLWRYIFNGTASEFELKRSINHNETNIQEIKAKLAKGEYQTSFPNYDGVSEKWFANSIAQKQESLAETRKSVAKGTYSVGIYPGWGTGDANYLHNAINNTQDKNAIAIYRKALERIVITSNIQMYQINMTIRSETRYMRFIKQLPIPDIKKMKIEIAQNKEMLLEWVRELDLYRKRSQRRINYLEMLKPFYSMK
jgi:anti-sigma28 factor (negative regulator of flagellin synthesis)